MNTEKPKISKDKIIWARDLTTGKIYTIPLQKGEDQWMLLQKFTEYTGNFAFLDEAIIQFEPKDSIEGLMINGVRLR